MATTYTEANTTFENERCRIVTWSLVNAETGQAYEGPSFADRSVQVHGTFGGATVVFNGSNDGTNFYTLTDPQGNAISITAAKIEAVSELTRYVRPVVSGGDGTTALVITMLGRRTPR